MSYSSLQRLFGKRKSTKDTSRKSRKGSHPRRAPRSFPVAVETLEDRTLLSVLPAPLVGNQQTLKAGNSPVVAYDPLNPKDLVAVYPNAGTLTIDYSTDGGETWGSNNGNGTITVQDIVNPQQPTTRYAVAASPSVAFDRNHKVYIVYDQTDGSANFTGEGALVMLKLDFSGANPVQVDFPTAAFPDPFGPGGHLPDVAAGGPTPYKILYQWDQADPALNPVVALDNNLPSYVDPTTGAVQTDTMAGKAIYVAWNTDNTAGTAGFSQVPFNPETIKVMASGDGGLTFTAPVFANASGNANIQVPNTAGDRFADPQIAFTQGSATLPGQTPTTPGGEMIFLWNNVVSPTAGGLVTAASQPDGGNLNQRAADAVSFVQDFMNGHSGAGGGAPVFPGINGPNNSVVPVTTSFNMTLDMTADPSVLPMGPTPDYQTVSTQFGQQQQVQQINDFEYFAGDPGHNFDQVVDMYVTLSLVALHDNELQITLTGPNGTVILLDNRTDSAGTDHPPAGVPDTANIGVVQVGSGNTAVYTPVGTRFMDDALRPINDPTVAAPYATDLQPEIGTFDIFTGLTWAQLQGSTWTLSITDTRTPANPPPPEFLMNWGLHFSAHISTTGMGTENPVLIPTTPLPGAPNSNSPNPPTAPPANPLGIGPGAVLAVDNTLGSFSPYQGRVYVAFTGRSTHGGGDAGDIYLTSTDTIADSFGPTWSNPVVVNDDSPQDGFSTGDRLQFEPNLAVDPVTGTVVVTYYDTRWDASQARVTRYVGDSIDGGQTFGPETYLNVNKTAIDAITGQNVTLEPIPDNESANGKAGALGFGDREGLAVYGGNIVALWAGNRNLGGSTIQGATSTIAAGPRIIAGDEGPVVADGATGGYDNTFTSDGTRQITGFVVTFDRPIDATTFTPDQVHLIYRNTSTPSSQPGVDLSNQIASITGINPDAPPTLTLGNAIVDEENANPVAVFPVILSVPVNHDVLVNFTTADGSALAGTDYGIPGSTAPVTGTLRILKGATSGTISIPILDDNKVEGNETFTLTLSNPPVDVSILQDTGTATIVEGDSAPALSIGDVTVPANGPQGGTTPATFTVDLSGPSSQPVTVPYSTADGTAVAGTDYTATSGTLTFAPGVTSQTITVPVVNHLFAQPNRTFFVNLGTPVGGTLARPQGTGTIIADGRAVSVGDTSVQENAAGATATFTVYLNSASNNQNVTVTYATAAGTAHAGTDYTASSGTVTILAGTSTATISVPILADAAGDDAVAEGNKTFTVNLTGATNAGILRGQGTGTIMESDALPALTVANAANLEGDPGSPNSVTFTVYTSFPVPIGQQIKVNYSTANGLGLDGAVAGTDYTATSGTLTIMGGQTSGTISVPIIPNLLPQDNRTFFLNLSPAAGTPTATIARSQATGTIIDDDVYVTVGDATVQEPTAGNTAQDIFTIFLDSPKSQAVTVTYATANGTAVAGTDYLPTVGAVTIPAGQTSATVDVPVIHDGNVKQNTTFALNLTGATEASILRGTGNGTIIDIDAPANLSVGDASGFEGDTPGQNNLTFTVYLSQTQGQDITVTYLTQGATAKAGTDYGTPGSPTEVTGSVTIPKGNLFATFSIPIIGNTTLGTNRIFHVLLKGATAGVTIVRGTNANPGTGLIVEDDRQSLFLEDAAVLEHNPANPTGPNSETFTAILSNPGPVDVAAIYQTSDNTAVAGVDYKSQQFVVVIPAGSDTATITVPVIPDSTPDANKDFNLTLTSPVGARLYAPQNNSVTQLTADGLIVDDNAPTLSVGDIAVKEGNVGPTPATFTIYLSAPTSRTVTVQVYTMDGTASDQADYQGIPQAQPLTVTFAPGTTTQTVTVTVNGNTTPQPNRTFFLVLDNPVGAGLAKAQGQATIMDDDNIPGLSVGDAIVQEPASGTVNATFNVYLSYPVSAPVTVQYATQDGTAVGSATPGQGDYQTTSGLLTFLPGGPTVQTVTVPVNGGVNDFGDKTFFVTLSNPTPNALLAKPQGNGVIVGATSPSLNVGDALVEAPANGTATATFTVILSQPSSQTVTVNYATADGPAGETGAVAGKDYVATSGTLTFQPGQTVQTITVPVLADNVENMDQTTGLTFNKIFFVNLSSPSEATLAKPQGVGTIVDGAGHFGATEYLVNLKTPLSAVGTYSYSVGPIIRDRLQTQGVGFAAGDATVQETAGGTTVSVPVFLSAPVDQDMTVTYTLVDGTAKAGTDYGTAGSTTPITGTVTIPAGQTMTTITVPILDDPLPDGNETFTVQLSNPVGATNQATAAGIIRPEGTVTIIDNKGTPAVSVGDVTVQENAPAGSPPGTQAGTATFTIYLNRPIVGNPITLDYTTLDGSATGTYTALDPIGGNPNPTSTPEDYTPTTGTITFQPGGPQQMTVSVPILSDLPPEAIEQFYLAVNADPNNVGTFTLARPEGTATIIPDNSPHVIIPQGPDDLPAQATTYTANVPSNGLPVQGGPVSAITSITESGNTVTVTTATPHGLSAGEPITIAGVPVAGYNGNFTVLSVTNANHFTYTDPTAANLPPSSGGTVTPTATSSTITISNVPAGEVVRDLTVNLTLLHPSPQNVLIQLVGPNGTAVTLYDGSMVVFGAPVASNFINVTFDDLAPLSQEIEDVLVPYADASFRPDMPLAALEDQSPNGTWTLQITDTNGTDLAGTGTLLNWSIDLQTGVDVYAGSPGNYMDQNQNAHTADQVRAPTDVFAVPNPINGVPFVLPYTSDSQPLIIPGPHLITSSTFAATPDQVNLRIPQAPGSPGGQTNPALNITTSTLTIPVGALPSDRVISDLNLNLSLLHSSDSDLTITLISPAGLQVVLVRGGEMSGQDMINTTFDDQATTPINSLLASAPYTGSFIPDSPLSALIGSSPFGTWTLQIVDGGNAPDSTGDLLSWSLQIQNNLVLNGPTNHIDVTFDRDVVPFNASAIDKIVGPQGTIYDPANGILLPGLTVTGNPYGTDPHPNTPRTYRISFPQQTISGTYTVTFGPNIQDVNGNKMDTNLNAGLDLLRGTTSTQAPQTTPVTYQQTLPIPIPAHTTASSPLKVKDNFVIQPGVELTLNISFPDDTQLEGTLVAPDGTQIKLFTKPGSSVPSPRANMQITTLVDTAGTNIQAGVAPFNGTFSPQSPLNALVGKNAAGTYTLLIKDDSNNLVGTINSWSLTLPEPLAASDLGEPVADQATASVRIFTMDPTNVESHNTWTAVGPTPINDGEGLNMAGPVSAMAVDPSDPSGNTVYVAAASGGIWKTTDFLTTDSAGPTYVPLTDFGPTFSLNIGSIAVFNDTGDPRNSVIYAVTGEGDATALPVPPSQAGGAPALTTDPSKGVGVLRSTDGGNTWQLLDSLDNVQLDANGNPVLDKNGNPIPLPLASRDGTFRGTTGYKIIVDPTPPPQSQKNPQRLPVVYLALGKGTTAQNGGVYVSHDGGNTWQKVLVGANTSDAIPTDDATDLTLVPSIKDSNGNLTTLYAGIKGSSTSGGVWISTNAGASWTWTSDPQWAYGANNPHILNFNIVGNPALPLSNSPTPNGANGNVVLATPFATGQKGLDLFYQDWVYALVSTAGGTLQGLYLSKDLGHTWTQIQIPETHDPVTGARLGIPTNDETQANYDPLSDAAAGLNGNYAISLAIDPGNPNVVYVGGTTFGQAGILGGLVRVDTTGLQDAYAYFGYDNRNNDGGQLEYSGAVQTQGAVTVGFPPPANGVGGPYQILFEDPFTGQKFLLSLSAPIPFLNLTGNPYFPLATGNSTIFSYDVLSISNSGTDIRSLKPFGSILPDGSLSPVNEVLDGTELLPDGTPNIHQILTLTDPATGMTRLIIGDDQGVYTGVGRPDGSLEPGVGSQPAVQGSRNGNLQIAQQYYGASQPSVLAAQIAGALFYATTNNTGPHTQAPANLLTSGNLTWTNTFDNPLGSGAGVATDQTGAGYAYTYVWPESKQPVGDPDTTLMWEVTPPGGAPTGQTTGLFRSNPDPRWALTGGSTFAVNPIDPNQVVMGSSGPQPGAVFRNEGATGTGSIAPVWNLIASPAQLDNTYVQALDFGAPDPTLSNRTDDFIYAGTQGGHIFVTSNGGGTWTNISAGLAATNAPVMQIIASPVHGSHAAFAVTRDGVYFIADSLAAGATWVNITGNLFALKFNPFGSAILAQPYMAYLTSLAVDWRVNKANGLTNPILYVGGMGGVVRSLTQGKTWTIFPDKADDGAIVDGGLLPDDLVTSLSLEEGAINPTTGLPDQTTGPNLLMATTYGRGSFAIHLTSNGIPGPRVIAFAPTTPGGPQVVGPGVSSVIVTFNEPIDVSTFTVAKIDSFTGPAGPIPIIRIDPVATGGSNSLTSFRITFPTQYADGFYTIVLGPNISDSAGDVMDQNGNGINGQPGIAPQGDEFEGVFAINTTDNGQFVLGNYEDLLGRQPDALGFETFLTPLDTVRFAELPTFATQIITSDEARFDLLYNPNTGTGYYPRFLHRAASPGELTGWLQALDQGVTPEQIVVGIVGSAEYFSTRAGENDTAFVQQSYQDLFARPVDAPSLQNWVNQLTTAEFNARFAVAGAIFGSDEYYIDLMYNPGTGQGWYPQFLGRAPQNAENYGFLVELRQGASDETVISQIVGSDEFYYSRAPQVTGSPASSQTYVQALYQLLLHRSPSGSELSMWSSQVDANNTVQGRSQVALEILSSDEYRIDLINSVFQQYLGRGAASGDLAVWLPFLRAGNRDELMVQTIVSSAEFYADQAGSATTLSGKDNNWVQNLYLKTLARGVDSGTLAADTGYLTQVEANARAQILQVLVNSDEWKVDLLDNVNNNTGFYPELLGRPAAPGEINAWLNVLRQGPTGPGQPNRDEQVEIGIVSSQEYFYDQTDPVIAGLHSNRGWLQSLYTNPAILGRAPDPAGFNANLANLIGSYAPQRAAVTATFVNGDEYHGDLVTGYYQTYLRRAISPPELQTWLTAFHNGITDEQILQAILSSAEYYNLAHQLNPQFDPNTAWLLQLYQDLLHRPADSSTQGFWNELQTSPNPAQTRAQIAGLLLGLDPNNPQAGTEYHADLVAQFYDKYLRRNKPIPANSNDPEIAGWVQALNAGVRDEQVITALLDSEEYFLLPHS